jgi:hypothetical protein
METMKRRKMLQSLTALPAVGLLRGQQAVVPPKPTPAAVEEIPVIDSTVVEMAGVPVQRFFDEQQFAALRRLSDMIVPASDDMPGALAAGAPEFLDFLVGELPAPRQEQYRSGLAELNRRTEKTFHVEFAAATDAQADEILSPLRQEWTPSPSNEFTAFLRTAKEDILRATFSSREWIRTASKHSRGASGIGTYWRPVE